MAGKQIRISKKRMKSVDFIRFYAEIVNDKPASEKNGGRNSSNMWESSGKNNIPRLKFRVFLYACAQRDMDLCAIGHLA